MQATPVIQNGVIDLITHSGPVAKMVLLVLLVASIFCWTIIIAKWRSLKAAALENHQFLNFFWNGKSIDEIFQRTEKLKKSPIAQVFKSGYKELKKLSDRESKPALEGVDNIGRALTRASNAEMANLERHVSWLATIASAGPFVGLFGTVWGIMNAFQNIGVSGSANLAVVAPGISEALITTATGIAAAVPAVVGYNQIAGQIKRIANDMDGFSHDFLNIIQRSFLAAEQQGQPRRGTE